MPARTPEEICTLFQRHTAAGDVDAVLGVYDRDVVFLSEAGEPKRGLEALRAELAPLVAARADFRFTILQVVQSDDIALMHTRWDVSRPRQMCVHAIEVARRQADGTWRWLIGDPFTVGRHTAS